MASKRLSEAFERLSLYTQLTKPRVTLLVLATAAAGFWLGPALGRADVFVPFLLGTVLCAGGANALNQWMEREPDSRMRRTRNRPIPSGRLSADEALRFGLLSAAAGLAFLAVTVNGLTAWLALACIASYVLVYTPLKRITALCTLMGAVPGAIPPMMGWAAARGSLDPAAWALFAILFIWQLPHFLAIAVLFREDYAAAGFKMLPVVEPRGLATSVQMVLYGLVLIPVSLVPTLLEAAGVWYFYGALAVGSAFLGACVYAALSRTQAACRWLFLASILYLPLLFALMVWDKGPMGG